MKDTFAPMVLGIDELCKTLGIGKNTAYELLSSGEIDSFKIGSCWKIPVESVKEYITKKCNERKMVLCEYISDNKD